MIGHLKSQKYLFSFKPICDALRDLVPFAQFKNTNNTHRGVLLLVKLQASACNFTKSNTPPWVFFMFFKLYECYQIAQSTTFLCNLPFLSSLKISENLKVCIEEAKGSTEIKGKIGLKWVNTTALRSEIN